MAGQNLCLSGPGGTNAAAFCAANFKEVHKEGDSKFVTQTGGVFITDSEVQRWGLGLVQEIDSAAMHLWIRWQHQEVDANFIGYSLLNEDFKGNGAKECFEDGKCAVRSQKLHDSFDDWDLFQIGGIIFF